MVNILLCFVYRYNRMLTVRTYYLLLTTYSFPLRTYYFLLTTYSFSPSSFSFSSRVGDGNRDGQHGKRPAQGRADPPVLPQSREQPRLGRPRDAHGGPQESRRQKSQDSQ